MTREEAIDILECRKDGDAVKALNMAIEALKAEECEDAISRQATLEQIYDWSKDEFLRTTNAFHYLRKRINGLPPVTPQPKMGRWMYDEDKSDWHDTTYRCSCCKRTIIIPYECQKDLYNDYPYCHCGAKMQEVEV